MIERRGVYGDAMDGKMLLADGCGRMNCKWLLGDAFGRGIEVT